MPKAADVLQNEYTYVLQPPLQSLDLGLLPLCELLALSAWGQSRDISASSIDRAEANCSCQGCRRKHCLDGSAGLLCLS